MANRRLPHVLDSPDQKISYRFTCQEDMKLQAAAVYCVEALQPPAYLVSLEEDAKGLPSGTPLASHGYIPLAKSWTTVPLDNVSLVKGKVYHLVVEQDVTRGGDHPVGVIGLSNYASFLTTDFLNHLHPNDGSPDPQANSLLWDKDHWKELNQEPVYAIYGAGNRAQGNPYDEPGARPIYGGGDPPDKSHQVLAGQTLHFHCGYSATSFCIRVRKQGNPASPLKYLILKNEFRIHKAIPMYSSVALTPGQVSPDFKWVTIGFDNKAAANFSPECWYLVFQTDSGRPAKNEAGCEDCYLLSDVGNSGGLAEAANLSFDGGPHLSREAYSVDGGSTSGWIDEFERDVNVGVLGANCPPLQPIEIRVVPTPKPLESDGGFQP